MAMSHLRVDSYWLTELNDLPHCKEPSFLSLPVTSLCISELGFMHKSTKRKNTYLFIYHLFQSSFCIFYSLKFGHLTYIFNIDKKIYKAVCALLKAIIYMTINQPKCANCVVTSIESHLITNIN